jgi:hypothetical protein
MTGLILLVAVLGFLSPANRGALLTSILVLYALMGIQGKQTKKEKKQKNKKQTNKQTFSFGCYKQTHICFFFVCIHDNNKKNI